MFVNQDQSLDEEMQSFWAAEAARIRAKPTAKRGSPERSLQRTGIRFLRTVLPEGSIVAAVVNEQRGNGRTEEERARFGAARKASGVLTGFWDTIALIPGPTTALIEWKAPGGVLSPAQIALHGQARAMGFAVIVADSLESLRYGLHREGIVTREVGGEMRAPKVRGL